MNDITTNHSDLLVRSLLAQSLGKSFNGDRDVYKQAGYPMEVAFGDYYGMYRRGGIARRIITLPVQGVWSNAPTINDDGTPEEQTELERAYSELDRQYRVSHSLAKVDELARIGRYAVLLVGTSDLVDNSSFIQPMGTGVQLTYLRAYSENRATIAEYDVDPTSPRHGLPTKYTIKTSSASSLIVHFSRVIHVAEHAIDDDVYGSPALEAVFNYLKSLEMVVASSGEMYWRTGFPGHQALVDKDARVSPAMMKDMKEQLDEYVHGLRRMLRLQGGKLEAIGGTVADPSGVTMMLMDLIAGTTGIPKRILLGSERGELASTQDHQNFGTLIVTRQSQHTDPNIMRPFIDLMIDHGALPPATGDGYNVVWADPFAPSEEGRVDIALKKAQAVRTMYGPSAGGMVPVRSFMEELGYDVNEDDLFQENDPIEDEVDDFDVPSNGDTNDNDPPE